MFDLEKLQYPIGKFVKGKSYSFDETKKNIASFEVFPEQLKDFVKDWDDKVLSVKYREGGWNGRQVIHHLADSHGNLPLRFKTCLTEENPQIKPYLEDRWAELYDSKSADIKPSLAIIGGLHSRLTILFKSLDESDWQKTIYHPESKHTFTLAELLALYAWHGSHHLGHLKIISNSLNLNS
jgi:hypothetical protein